MKRNPKKRAGSQVVPDHELAGRRLAAKLGAGWKSVYLPSWSPAAGHPSGVTVRRMHPQEGGHYEATYQSSAWTTAGERDLAVVRHGATPELALRVLRVDLQSTRDKAQRELDAATGHLARFDAAWKDPNTESKP